MLLKQEVEKHNITVSDEELDNALNEAKKSLPQGMTLDAMLNQSGMNMDEMREDIGLNLGINKLFESQLKVDFTPTDEELKAFFLDNKEKYDIPEKVHARHILIKVDKEADEKTKAEKKAKIEDIRKQLLEGADFAKLASENSECPSAKQGGDLGTFSRGRMVPPFEDAAFSQEVNEIGTVVETQFGYHIIQVLEHTSAEEKTFDEVKDKLAETMKNQKKQELVKGYLAELKEKATIVYGTSGS
jgi:peptidyl-prolyl cis-trans isomerase C